MPEQSETPHPDYTKGFNEGYLMSQHEPVIADSLAKAIVDTERGKGFKDGRSHYLQEKNKSLYPEWLKSEKADDATNSKEQEQDKDGIDRD